MLIPVFEYYTRPFELFRSEIKDKIKLDTFYLRADFLREIPEGTYFGEEAWIIFNNYNQSLEDRAKKIISKYSIAYWLHLSRRIAVGSGGPRKDAITVNYNRTFILALIQKYGRWDLCESINTLRSVKIDEIFKGLFLQVHFAFENNEIRRAPDQLVLTDFDSGNLLEYYEIENICYEIWACGAKLREVGKGSRVVVVHNRHEFFFNEQDNELHSLISLYDSRLLNEDFVTEVGTVPIDDSPTEGLKFMMLNLNSSNIPSYYISSFFYEKLGVIDREPMNFVVCPFPLREYLEVNRIFEDIFQEAKGIGFASPMAFIGALCLRHWNESAVNESTILLRLIKRGYEGPIEQTSILEEVWKFFPKACEMLGLEISKKRDIELALDFLSLNTARNIDIDKFGSLKVLMPERQGYYFVDYSVIPFLLKHLFDGLDLAGKNEKGHGFEKSFEKSVEYKSYLVKGPLKALDGTKKQIDFSYLIGNILLIVEIKSVIRRGVFFHGSPEAINFRARKLTGALKQADDKAEWLKGRRKGKNYNLEIAEFILPIVVTPFVEYIHSKENKYWINDSLPRVLTRKELNSFIKNFDRIEIKYNLVKFD